MSSVPEVPENEPDQPQDKPVPFAHIAWLPRPIRAALGWALAGRLRAALVASACLVSIVGGVCGWILLGKASPPPVEVKVTLALCLETLDAGQYGRAADLAKRLQETGTHSLAQQSGTAFVLGVAAAAGAERVTGKTRLEQYACAARYLEESRDLDFPEGREGEGFYWLGKSLYLSGRISAARTALHEALKRGDRFQSELHRMLADAFMRGEDVDLDRAAEHNKAYLADSDLPPEARDAAILQRADILIRQNRAEECPAILTNLSPTARNAAPALVVRARLLMREAQTLSASQNTSAAKEKTRQAIALLRKAESSDIGDTGAIEAAMYLIGVCFLEADDRRAALAQFQRTRRIHSDRPEGAAANLQEADLLRRESDWSGAMAAYRRGLEKVTAPDEYANTWIPLSELRSRVKSLVQSLLDRKEFGECLQASKMLSSIFGKAKALEMTAEICETWSRDLLARAEGLHVSKAEPLQRQARAHLRKAGDIHAEMAKLQHATRQYPDELWNAAGCHFQGRDYRKAVAELDEYLKSESQRRQPQALVMQGEAFMAIDQLDDAIAAFTQCIDYHPRDVASFRARLLAAQAWAEKGDVKRAEAFLLENLSGELLSPAGKEWRDSLFQLGELLHREKRYDEAIARLDESLQRYHDAPQAYSARYLLAHSRQEVAKAALYELQKDLSAEERIARQRQFDENIAKAELLYRELREESLRRESREGLRPHEAAIARNAAFALGEILADQGDFPAAIKLYYAAANRAFDRPEALNAYLQIARLYRRLGKTIESKTTIEQAKALLAALKAEADIVETTNYDRKQWADLLDGLSKL